jgi:hypothetical protein
MATFEPCPGCQRHVKIDEARCPFCAMELSEPFSRLKARVMPRTRLGRAALFAFGVGAGTSVLTNCASDDDDGDEQADGGTEESAEDDASVEEGSPQPVYGAAPADGGAPVNADDDAGGSVALYGGAPAT